MWAGSVATHAKNAGRSPGRRRRSARADALARETEDSVPHLNMRRGPRQRKQNGLDDRDEPVRALRRRLLSHGLTWLTLRVVLSVLGNLLADLGGRESLRHGVVSAV